MRQSHIGIASIVADSAGDILVPYIESKSDFGTSERRSTRSKTLDGGVIVSDGGWTSLDRDIKVVMHYAADAWTKLQHLHQDKTLVHIALSDGFFKGTIKRLRSYEGEIRLTVWLTEKLSD